MNPSATPHAIAGQALLKATAFLRTLVLLLGRIMESLPKRSWMFPPTVSYPNNYFQVFNRKTLSMQLEDKCKNRSLLGLLGKWFQVGAGCQI